MKKYTSEKTIRKLLSLTDLLDLGGSQRYCEPLGKAILKTQTGYILFEGHKMYESSDWIECYIEWLKDGEGVIEVTDRGSNGFGSTGK